MLRVVEYTSTVRQPRIYTITPQGGAASDPRLRGCPVPFPTNNKGYAMLRTTILALLLCGMAGCATDLANPKPSPQQIAVEQQATAKLRYERARREAIEKAKQEKEEQEYRTRVMVRLGRTMRAINQAAEEICKETGKFSDCTYKFEMNFSNEERNAYADGKKIYLTAGMMDFVQGYDELALVVGHEVAHNVLEHRANTELGAVLGGFVGFTLDLGLAVAGVNTGGAITKFGMAVGARTKSKEFERDADYLGLYLAARAGFDVSDTPSFWHRLAASRDEKQKDGWLASHPLDLERAAAIRLAIEEINQKRQEGRPLLPEFKKE